MKLVIFIIAFAYVIASIVYYVMFFTDERYEDAENKQEFLKMILIPFYCWYIDFKEFWNDLEWKKGE